jgi:hypothetical protein
MNDKQPSAEGSTPLAQQGKTQMSATVTKQGKPFQIIKAPDEAWVNDTYCVMVTRRENGTARLLNIRRHDWQPVTDWRAKQSIKNGIAGPECEAVELYPAESRVVDTLNWFHLWVLPPGQQFPFGFPEGRKSDTFFVPGQRPLAQGGCASPLVRTQLSRKEEKVSFASSTPETRAPEALKDSGKTHQFGS